jgi:Zn-dependent peptidase ImmA (M78 family)/DNA-binding XRE family transcriptional regulator
VFSKNLKYYRLKNNLSKKKLAEKIGITSMAISHYEKGSRTPNTQILYKLAEALNVGVMDFLAIRNESLEFVHGEFRKNSRLGKNKQLFVQESIEEYFNRFFNIVFILGEAVLPKAPKRHALYLENNDEENAKNLRIFLTMAPEGPVGNLVDMLENKGILTYLHEFDDEGFSGINGLINRRPYIAINKNMSPERQRFTIAHELAHMFFIWPDDMPESSRDQKANSIAGAFMFPQADAIRELGPRRSGIFRDMELAAKEYGISMLCLAYRAKELRIISEASYRDFMIRASQIGWRKDEPPRIQREESRLFEQLVFHAVAEDTISIQKGAELLQVPYAEVKARTGCS